MYCTRRVSGITVIWIAQYQNIGKPNNLKVFGINTSNVNKLDSQNLL